MKLRNAFILILCSCILAIPSKATSSSAPVGPGLHQIKTEHNFQVNPQSGQITGVNVQSQLQPEGKAEGTWTFELYFGQGENPETVRSDEGSAVIPMESPRITPADQPAQEYYIITHFKGRVDGQPTELMESYAFSIPDIRLGATRDGKDQKTYINTNGENSLIVIADPRRNVLHVQENTSHLSVDLKPGEYLVSVMVRDNVSLMETRRLNVPEKGDSDTYPVKGETDRYLSSDTAQKYIDQIKKTRRLLKPESL